MQPCAACGGVTFSATGHCTQCGTLRAGPPPTPGYPDGYPQGGAPGYGPPAGAGYPAPMAGPGYQPQPGTPGYQPQSGAPGYGPQAGAPGGYPMSAPPGGYPGSGGPAYPGSGGPAYPGSGGPAYAAPASGGYPPGYPGPAGPDNSRKARPFVVPLVALSATLVVLVVAIVIVVVVRSGDDADTPVAGPTPGPTGNPNVDSCVVGTWRVLSHTEQVGIPDIGTATFTGGQGAMVELTADGSGTTTYRQTTYESEVEGQNVVLELDGTIRFEFTARDGTVSFRNMRPNGTARALLDGVAIRNETLSSSDDPAKYKCDGSTMSQSTNLYETQLTKVG